MDTEMHKVAEESARGGFFLMLGSSLSTLILGIATILVGRLLGPEMYGQYTLAFVVPQVLILFGDLGVSQGLMKFPASFRTSGETGRLKQLIQCGMLLRVSIGIALFAITFVFAESFASTILIRPDLAIFIRIASIAIIFQLVSDTVVSVFVGLDKTEYNALTTIIQAITKGAVAVSLVLFGFGVAGAVLGTVAGYIASSVIGTGILIFFLKRHFRASGKGDFSQNLKTLVNYGIPLYASSLVFVIIGPYQNLILAMFTSNVDIGNFRAAKNFTALLTLLAAPIVTSMLPAFSKLDSSSKAKAKDFFMYANKYTSLLIVPATVYMIVFSNEIIRTIYGTTYQNAGFFLSLNSLVFFLVGIGYLTQVSLFNGLGETRIVLRTTLVNVSIAAILAPLLGQKYGVAGLIVSTLVAITVSTFYGAYIARKRFQVEYAAKSLGKIYLVGVIAALPALLLLRLSVTADIFKIALGGLVYLFTYVTLVPATKVITLSELETATVILQEIRLLNHIAKPLIKYEKMVLSLAHTRSLT